MMADPVTPTPVVPNPTPIVIPDPLSETKAKLKTAAKKFAVASFWTVLLTVGGAWGWDWWTRPTQAKSVITAPSVVPVGQLVLFKADQSVANAYQWLMFGPDGNLLSSATFESGKVLPFSSGTKGTYSVVLSTAFKNTIDVAVLQFSVGDVPPGPNPPGPGPGPVEPVLPDGTYKLSRLSYDKALQVINKNKFDEAVKLADAIDKSIGTTAETPDEFVALTKKNTAAALGEAKLGWDVWNSSVGNYLDSLRYDLKTMVTLDQYRTAWKEVVVGLREYVRVNRK